MATRDTMGTLISRIRMMTNAGYDVSDAATYFLDEDIQDFLDRNRRDLWDVTLQARPRRIGGGSVAYYDYAVGYGDLEATQGGTALFLIRDGLGATIGTASYTLDTVRGLVTFGVDTRGSARYADARTYDVNAAAADLLEAWASREKLSFDVQTEDQRFTRSQKIKQILEMAAHYRSQAAIVTVPMFRSDAC